MTNLANSSVMTSALCLAALFPVVGHAQGDCHASFTFSSDELSVAFIDASGGDNPITSWSWTFGDGGTSSDQGPQHTYAHAGIYTVCLTTHDDHGCSATVCQHVTLHDPVEATCTAAFTFHAIDDSWTVGFADESTSDNMIIAWTWDFGDGGMATEPSPQHTYVHPGIYTVCLTTLDDHGCTTTHCQHVTVHHPVVGTCHAGFAYTTVADDLAFAFTDASDSEFPIISWGWDFGDGITSTEEDPQHTYAHAGIYTVCQTIHDDHGCAATVCQELIVHHPEGTPCHAEFTFAPVGDLGLDFTGTSGGDIAIASWSWDFGDGNNSTEQHPFHTYPHEGTFTACLTTVDDHGCTSTACHGITLHVATSVAQFDADAYVVDAVPNPSAGSFRLSGGAGLSPGSQLEVHDIAGRVVARSTLQEAREKGMDMVAQPAGVYLLRLPNAAHRARILIVH